MSLLEQPVISEAFYDQLYGEEGPLKYARVFSRSVVLGGEQALVMAMRDQARIEDMDRRNRVLAEIDDSKVSYLTPEMADFLKWAYWGGGDKRILGTTVGSLVNKHGLLVPERSVHETMHEPIAIAAAADLKTIVENEEVLGPGRKNVVELNTGLGSLTMALKKHFSVLATVEKTRAVYEATQQLWRNLQLPLEDTEWILDDARDFLKKLGGMGDRVNGNRVDLMAGDPPWSPMLNGSGEKDVRSLVPSAKKITELMLRHAPVAAIKLPGTFKQDSLSDLAGKVNASVVRCRYTWYSGDRKIVESLAVFLRHPDIRLGEVGSLVQDYDRILD